MTRYDKTELVRAQQPSGKVDWIKLTSGGDGKPVFVRRVDRRASRGAIGRAIRRASDEQNNR